MKTLLYMIPDALSFVRAHNNLAWLLDHGELYVLSHRGETESQNIYTQLKVKEPNPITGIRRFEEGMAEVEVELGNTCLLRETHDGDPYQDDPETLMNQLTGNGESYLRLENGTSVDTRLASIRKMDDEQTPQFDNSKKRGLISLTRHLITGGVHFYKKLKGTKEERYSQVAIFPVTINACQVFAEEHAEYDGTLWRHHAYLPYKEYSETMTSKVTRLPSYWSDDEQRDYYMLAFGFWNSLPEQLRWVYNIVPVNTFPHPALKDQSRIAYRVPGKRNSVVTTFGRFLRKFSEVPLTDKQIQQASEEYAIWANSTLKLDDSYEYTLESEEGCFAAAYNNDVDSCMTAHKLLKYDLSYHPAEAYASGDFAVATAMNKSNDRIEARAIVCTKNKAYWSVYPKDGNGDPYNKAAKALVTFLSKQGFSRKSGWSNGAKLRKLWESGNDCYVIPYIDSSGSLYEIEGDDKYFYLADDHDDLGTEERVWHFCSSTSGYDYDWRADSDGSKAYVSSAVSCSVCGDSIDPNYTSYDDIVDEDGDVVNTPVCEACLPDNAVFIEDVGWVRREDVIYCDSSDECVLSREAVYCEYDGGYAPADDAVLLYNGEYAYPKTAVALYNGEYAHEDDSDLVELHFSGDRAINSDDNVVRLYQGLSYATGDMNEFLLLEDTTGMNQDDLAVYVGMDDEGTSIYLSKIEVEDGQFVAFCDLVSEGLKLVLLEEGDEGFEDIEDYFVNEYGTPTPLVQNEMFSQVQPAL